MPSRCQAAWLVHPALFLGLLSSCGSTLDRIGCTERGPGLDGGLNAEAAKLAALLPPASYPNAFREILGKSDSEIASKISGAFDQLFHGDPSREAIFVPVGADQGYIADVYHDEIRSEGGGLGMIITVELDKRDEFDRLWRYAKATQVKNGPRAGYFPSFCTNSAGDEVACDDPYGLQQIATGLLLARGRWQDSAGTIDYGLEAEKLLDIIRNKEAFNCGIVDEVTSTFDPTSKLAYDTPTTSSANVSSPAIVMPAYYDLWHQATGDPFWSEAAAAARSYWAASSNPVTGLMPVRATFDGTPVVGFDTFRTESYRTFFNIALDRIWGGGLPWLVDESNRLSQFFYAQGITSYGQVYSLDGTDKLSSRHEAALVAANGVVGLVATSKYRSQFVAEAWDLAVPTGGGRYYAGILQLLSLLILGGQMRVF